jgi:hypothetical protein
MSSDLDVRVLWLFKLLCRYAFGRYFFLSCLCDFRYNPYVQARSRIDQLKRLGHSVDKVCR